VESPRLIICYLVFIIFFWYLLGTKFHSFEHGHLALQCFLVLLMSLEFTLSLLCTSVCPQLCYSLYFLLQKVIRDSLIVYYVLFLLVLFLPVGCNINYEPIV